MRNCDAAAEDRLAVRRMLRTDLPSVIRIEARSFVSPWQRIHFLHEIERNELARNWVALRGGRIVAYAAVWVVFEELRINKIAVDPRFRGRGFGSRLLGRVLAEGRSEGCTAVTLEVRASNGDAIRLYERHGFLECGRRADYYRGEDAILMRRELPAVGPAGV